MHQAAPEELLAMGQLLGFFNRTAEQRFKGGTTADDGAIDSLVNARVAAKKAKNWAEADRIRDELKAQGILLEDRPDGSTDWRRG